MTKFIKASEAKKLSEVNVDKKHDDFMEKHTDLMSKIHKTIEENAAVGANKIWFEFTDDDLCMSEAKMLKDVLKSYGYRVKFDFVLSEEPRGGGLMFENVKFNQEFYNEADEFAHYTVDAYISWV